MVNVKLYSPFYTIKRTITILRWIFGFPLIAKDNSYTEFRFATLFECARFLVLSLITMIYHVYWIIVLLIVDGNLKNFIYILKETNRNYSENAVDVAVLLLMGPSAVMISLVYLLIYRLNIESINRFCIESVSISCMISVVSKDRRDEKAQKCWILLRKPKRLLIYGQLLSMTASVLFGIWTYNTLIVLPKESIFNNYATHYLPPLMSINGLFILYGPLCFTVELFICQMIDSSSDLFLKWTIIIEEQTKIQPSYQEQVNKSRINLKTTSQCVYIYSNSSIIYI
jgi:hypothetical protein